MEKTQDLSLESVVAMVEQVLFQGAPAGQFELPDADGAADLIALLEKLEAVFRFTLALGKGNLAAPLAVKGTLPGALKALQSNLRHVTWQTRRIADGDFSQQVDFLGDFSEAFNRMTLSLKETREALARREEELKAGNAELERINTELQQRLEEIHRLQDSLREEAIRDPLTGLYNRRFLNEVLPRELVRAEREQRPVGVLMADIDHFKKINDTYGHPAGDRVLRELSSLLRSRTRAGDFSCRFGGEEFIVVMPAATLAQVRERAELIREEFSSIGIDFEAWTIRATVSIGVADSSLHGRTQEELVRRVDAALYAAKSQGRNRVVSA